MHHYVLQFVPYVQFTSCSMRLENPLLCRHSAFGPKNWVGVLVLKYEDCKILNCRYNQDKSQCLTVLVLRISTCIILCTRPARLYPMYPCLALTSWRSRKFANELFPLPKLNMKCCSSLASQPYPTNTTLGSLHKFTSWILDKHSRHTWLCRPMTNTALLALPA